MFIVNQIHPQRPAKGIPLLSVNHRLSVVNDFEEFIQRVLADDVNGGRENPLSVGSKFHLGSLAIFLVAVTAVSEVGILFHADLAGSLHQIKLGHYLWIEWAMPIINVVQSRKRFAQAFPSL